MLHDTPLRPRHEQYVREAAGRGAVPGDRPGAASGYREAGPVEYLAYGPAGDGREEDGAGCEVPAWFDGVEVEYAVMRRAAGIMDCPQRGTLRLTGADRREFLNRMLTQELKDLAPGIARAGFWLNRKGRIDADILVIDTDDATYLDVDIHQAALAHATLSEFVFTEDLEIVDVSDAMHRIAMHGPAGGLVLAAASPEPAPDLEPGRAGVRSIGGIETVVARRDQIGAAGLEIIVPKQDVEAVWNALLGTDVKVTGGKRGVRPVGWYAYNMARIEGGTPLFNVDFGPTNMPHETGVLRDRVSFTKGCYPGQEIVARIESLGQPKQTLVGLKIAGDLLPVAGEQVFAREDGRMGATIGLVTSSTLSPMLGARGVAFAMIGTAHAEPGTTLVVNAEGRQGEAEITDLSFFEQGTDDG